MLARTEILELLQRHPLFAAFDAERFEQIAAGHIMPRQNIPAASQGTSEPRQAGMDRQQPAARSRSAH
jgi:hypothetical protein